jgi:hypothetical protein
LVLLYEHFFLHKNQAQVTSGHLSPPQLGGGISGEYMGNEDVENNRHITIIFDEKNKIILNAGRLLTQQEQNFNQNHWKIAPSQKLQPTLAQQ